MKVKALPRASPARRAAAVAAVAAWGLTPVAARLAARLGVLDRPGTASYKRQSAPIPALGGLAVSAAVGLGAAAGLRLLHDAPTRRVATALGLSLAAGAVGVADDVRPRPWAARLAAEAGIAAVASGVGVRDETPTGHLGVATTIVWVTGVATSFNLTDNMDGLAAGSAAASGACLALLCDDPADALLGAAVAGAAAGFWVHNRHPATVYLGDGGAMFLGTLLALISTDLARSTDHPPTTSRLTAPLVPLVVLGLPIFDAAFVTITRLARGRSPFQGGRDHTSHRLVAAGLPIPAASTALVVVSAGLGAAGTIVTRGSRWTRTAALGTVAAVAAGAAAALASLPDDGEPRPPLDPSRRVD